MLADVTDRSGAMSRSAPITIANEMPLARNAAPAPRVARTRPASAGPNARAPVKFIELSRTALSMSAGGTSWGTNACQAEIVNPFATAPTSTRPVMPIGVASPLIHSNQRPNAESIDTDCAQISNDRRE